MPKSTRKRSTGRARSTSRGAVETITRSKQSWPIVLLLTIWRWRWELIVVAAVAYIVRAHGADIAAFVGDELPVWFTVVLTLLVGWWLIVDNPIRRFLSARVWCVTTRHRIRACLTEMRTLNYSGNLPFILGCFSTKTGQVVWLWMRPGLSIEDLDNKAETLASACWARKATIARSKSNAAIVRIDIDRRDPLAKKTIDSPLLQDTSGLPEAAVADDAVLAFLTPDNASEDSITQAPAKTAGSESRTRTSKTKTTAAVTDNQTVILGPSGEDVSDYV